MGKPISWNESVKEMKEVSDDAFDSMDEIDKEFLKWKEKKQKFIVYRK